MSRDSLLASIQKIFQLLAVNLIQLNHLSHAMEKAYAIILNTSTILSLQVWPTKFISSKITVWFFYHGKPNDSKLIFWFLRRGRSDLLHSTSLSLALDRPRLYLLLPRQRNQKINFAQRTFYDSRLLLYSFPKLLFW